MFPASGPGQPPGPGSRPSHQADGTGGSAGPRPGAPRPRRRLPGAGRAPQPLPLCGRPPGDRQRAGRGGRGAGSVAQGAQAARPVRGAIGRPHLAAPHHRQLRHRLHPRPPAPRAGLRPDRPARCRQRRVATPRARRAGAARPRAARFTSASPRRWPSSPRRSGPPSCCATSRGCRSTRSGGRWASRPTPPSTACSGRVKKMRVALEPFAGVSR